MALEEEFGVEIPDEDAEKLVTVGDAVNYLKEHASRTPAGCHDPGMGRDQAGCEAGCPAHDRFSCAWSARLVPAAGASAATPRTGVRSGGSRRFDSPLSRSSSILPFRIEADLRPAKTA